MFRHPSLRKPPMKVFSLQAPIYRGAWLSRLSPSLQSHKASPSPCRSHPSRVPLNHQPGDRPVSHRAELGQSLSSAITSVYPLHQGSPLCQARPSRNPAWFTAGGVSFVRPRSVPSGPQRRISCMASAGGYRARGSQFRSYSCLECCAGLPADYRALLCGQIDGGEGTSVRAPRDFFGKAISLTRLLPMLLA